MPNHHLRRWCSMHVLNLGVYLIAVAEGILFLAETECRLGSITMPQALRCSYDSFRAWRSANRIACSVRPWKLTHFHLGENPATPTQHPWLNLKAYNARCVLGWLADSKKKTSAHYVFYLCVHVCTRIFR